MLTCRVPRFAVLLVLASAVLGGCTPSTSASSPTPAVSVTSAPPTPTLSDGQKAANYTVVKYRALIDELRQQYKPDVARLSTLSRGAAYEKWRYTLQDDFVNGYHQVGTTSVAIVTTDPGATSQQWIVNGCLDTSQTDIVDKYGKTTLTTPEGKVKVVYTVDQDATSLSWFVTKDEVKGSC